MRVPIPKCATLKRASRRRKKIQVRIVHPATGQTRTKMFPTLAEAKEYAAPKKRHGWEVSISRVKEAINPLPRRVHGDGDVPNAPQPKIKGPRVKIVRGGLPGLGKR